MENRWIKAATILRPTTVVCGRRLLPFCLRHRVALEALESPFITMRGDFSPQDVMLAARVLSSHNNEIVREPWTIADHIRLGMMTVSEQRLLTEIAKLGAYFNAQSLWPRFWEKEQAGSKSSIPWQLTIVAGLVRSGVDLEQAWTMPEAEAVWLYFANAKAEGASIDIVSEEEWNAMEKYRQEQMKEQTNNQQRN